MRQELLQRVALVEAKRNPAAAAALVMAQIPPGAVQTEAIISVVNQWALRDPADAAAWIASFPEGFLKARATTEWQGMANAR